MTESGPPDEGHPSEDEPAAEEGGDEQPEGVAPSMGAAQSPPALAEQRDIEVDVYQPAEDSRLLAETVVSTVSLAAGDRVLDVGTGSGFVGAQIVSHSAATVVGSDINRMACKQARGAGIQTVQANLLDPFGASSFDVVVCNPPYLPTPPEQEWDDHMEQALSGGSDGRSVIDPFLADVSRVLVPDGRAYLLISTLTEPAVVRDTAADAGLHSEVIATESHPFERLLVLELRLSAHRD